MMHYTVLDVWGEIGNDTHVLLDLSLHACQLLLVRDIALVVCDAPRLSIRHLSHIQHCHRGAAHAIHLGNEQAEAAGAAGDDDDFVLEVDVAGQTKGQAPVDLPKSPADGDEGGVPYGDAEGDLVPVHVLGAEAQRDHPGDKGVEEGDIEDLQEEVDGERREPRVALWWALEAAEVCHIGQGEWGWSS